MNKVSGAEERMRSICLRGAVEWYRTTKIQGCVHVEGFLFFGRDIFSSFVRLSPIVISSFYIFCVFMIAIRALPLLFRQARTLMLAAISLIQDDLKRLDRTLDRLYCYIFLLE